MHAVFCEHRRYFALKVSHCRSLINLDANSHVVVVLLWRNSRDSVVQSHMHVEVRWYMHIHET